MKKCPFCQEEIQDSAIKCRYCGEWLNKQDKPPSNKDIPADKIATPIISTQQQSTAFHPHEERPQIIGEGNKWFRWGVFIVGTGLLLVIYAVWKMYDESHSGGFVTGFARGFICVGGIIWLFYWAKDTPPNNLKQSEHNIDNDRTPENISLWNWKSFISAFLIAFLLNIILAGITDTKPYKNILGTVCWIYLTIEAWKYWHWKALLPFSLYLFALTIGFLFLKSAGVEYHSTPVAILLIVSNVGGLAIFYIFLNRSRSSVISETSVNSINEDAEIEKIIRESETKSSGDDKRDATYYSTSEVKNNDEEFIALLQSSIEENGLNTIPGNELIEIYNQAKIVESRSNQEDDELSKAINTLSQEIGKRGLNVDSKPQVISNYENTYSTTQDKERVSARYIVAIIGAMVVVFVGVVSFNIYKSYQSEAADKYFNMGYDYSKMEQYQKAVESYDEAIKFKTNFIAAYYNRGVAHEHLGNFNQSLQDYEKVIELNPQDAGAYFGRGNAYNNIGNYNLAIQDYNKAIELNPRDGNYFNNRGNAYFMQGNNNLGCLDAQKACEMTVCNGLEWAKGHGYCN